MNNDRGLSGLAFGARGRTADFGSTIGPDVDSTQRADPGRRLENMQSKEASVSRWRIDERGTIMAEYAVLLCVVAVGCSLAVVGLGAPLVRLFMVQELWLALAVP